MGKTSVKGNKRKTLFGKRCVHPSQKTISSDRPPTITRQKVLLRQSSAFIQRHPFLVWSGAWVMMMSLCWISVTGLLHVDPFDAEAQPEIVADQPQIPQLKPRQQAKPASSFGLLAAIAVSCGATSLLLAKQLTPTKSQRGLVIKRPSSAIGDEIDLHQPPKAGKLDLKPQAPVEKIRRSAPITQSTVTVLSPEETHPLDWGDASLADLMDIRKQQSLSNYP